MFWSKNLKKYSQTRMLKTKKYPKNVYLNEIKVNNINKDNNNKNNIFLSGVNIIQSS